MERIGAMSIGTCLYLASLLGYVKVGNPGRHVFLRQGVAIQLRLTHSSSCLSFNSARRAEGVAQKKKECKRENFGKDMYRKCK
jgi:hypothetical protein